MSQLKPTEVSIIESKPRKYQAVEWENGNPPAINAKNLAKSEKALSVLLGHDDPVNGIRTDGVVSKLIDKLNAEIDARTDDIQMIIDAMRNSINGSLPLVDATQNGQIMMVQNGVWDVAKQAGITSIIIVASMEALPNSEDGTFAIIPSVEEGSNTATYAIRQNNVWYICADGSDKPMVDNEARQQIANIIEVNNQQSQKLAELEQQIENIPVQDDYAREQIAQILTVNSQQSSKIQELEDAIKNSECNDETARAAIAEIVIVNNDQEARILRLEQYLSVEYNFLVVDSLESLPSDAPEGTIALIPAGQSDNPGTSDQDSELTVLIYDSVEELPETAPDGTFAVIKTIPGNGTSGSNMLHYSVTVPNASSSTAYNWVINDDGSASLNINNLSWANPDALVELKCEDSTIFNKNFLTLTLNTGSIRFEIASLPATTTEVYVVVYDSKYQGSLNGGT